jgi:hypothetical protein
LEFANLAISDNLASQINHAGVNDVTRVPTTSKAGPLIRSAARLRECS